MKNKTGNNYQFDRIATNWTSDEFKELQDILKDLEFYIQLNDGQGGTGSSSGLNSKDHLIFFDAVNTAITINSSTKAYAFFDLAIMNDFNNWSIDKINKLSVFFKIFSTNPMFLKFDADLLNSLALDKFSALVNSMKAINCIVLASMKENTMLEKNCFLSLEKEEIIKSTFTNMDLVYGIYEKHSDMTALQALAMYHELKVLKPLRALEPIPSKLQNGILESFNTCFKTINTSFFKSVDLLKKAFVNNEKENRIIHRKKQS